MGPWRSGWRCSPVRSPCCSTGCSAHDAERDLRFGWPTGVTKQAERDAGPVDLVRRRRARRRRARLGPDLLVLHPLPQAETTSCRGRPSTTCRSRSSYTIVPFLIIAGLFWRTVVVEDNVDAASQEPRRARSRSTRSSGTGSSSTTPTTRRGHAYPGPPDQRRNARNRTSRPASPGHLERAPRAAGTTPMPYYLSTVGTDDEIPVLVIPVGETMQIDRALRRRHPLVLGAGVPVQARRHPVRHRRNTGAGQPLRVHRHLDRQLRRAAAPSCAARTTRR